MSARGYAFSNGGTYAIALGIFGAALIALGIKLGGAR